VGGAIAHWASIPSGATARARGESPICFREPISVGSAESRSRRFCAVRSRPILSNGPSAEPLARGGRRDFDHVARQASIRFGGLAFDKILGYLFALFVAKTYGSTELGLYLFGVGLFEIAFAVSELGADRAAVRESASRHARGRDAEIPSVAKGTLALTLPISIAIGAAIALGAPVVASALERPYLGPFLVVGAAALPLTILADAFLYPIEGLGLQRWTVAIRMVVEPIAKVLLAVVFFFALGAGAEIGALGLAYVLSIALSAALAYLAFRSVVARSEGGAWPLRPLLRIGLPACALNVLARLLAWYDIFLVFTLVSAEATSSYTVALRTALLTTMLASSFDAAFKPAIAAAIALERREELTAEYLRVSRSVLLLCLPAVVMLALFPRVTMAVLGDQFVVASPVVAIVALGTLTSFLAGPAVSALVMAGRTRAPLVNGFAGGAIGIATALLLVPRLGIVGAAAGQFASMAIAAALNARAAWRELGVIGVGRDHARPLAAAIVAAAAGLAAAATAPANKYLAFLVVGAAVTIGYIVAIAAIGLREDDVRLIRGVLHLPAKR
jgi:O-antigen/teichoic acid export membrane protein